VDLNSGLKEIMALETVDALLTKLVDLTIESLDSTKHAALLVELRTITDFSAEQLQKALSVQLSTLEDLQVDVPKCFDTVSLLVGTAAAHGMVNLAFLTESISQWYEDEKRAEFLQLVQSAIASAKDAETAKKLIADLPTELKSLLADTADESATPSAFGAIVSILENNGSVAEIEAALAGVSSSSETFINDLVAAVLSFVSSKTTLTSEEDKNVEPSEEVAENESEQFKKIHSIIKSRVTSQAHVIAAVVDYAESVSYPPKFLSRWLDYLYDSNIVSLEAIAEWLPNAKGIAGRLITEFLAEYGDDEGEDGK